MGESVDIRRIEPSRYDEVFSLRYKVLVEQREWRIRSADASRRIVRDAYDDHAIHFGAYREAGDVLIGCVRGCVWARLPPNLRDPETGFPKALAEMITNFDERTIELARRRCSYTSRLCVDRDYVMRRPGLPISSKLMLKLSIEIYRWGVENAVEIDWIACLPDEALAVYRRFGYRLVQNDCVDPDFPAEDPKAISAVMNLDLSEETSGLFRYGHCEV